MKAYKQFLSWALLSAAILLPAGTALAEEQKSESAPSQVLVVNTGDGTVSLVDIPTMKTAQTHKVGPRPYGIAVSKDGKTVAVGVEDEERVKFFSLPDFKPKGETKIGKMFNDHIVLTPDGKHILVANFYSDDVVGIDGPPLSSQSRKVDGTGKVVKLEGGFVSKKVKKCSSASCLYSCYRACC